MSAYLTKGQEKKLRETYKFHNCKRFHSMNAAIKYTDDGFHFYSYYTWCVSWYPSANVLEVAPIVYDDYNYSASPSTTRQVNRFLREYVAPNINVEALKYTWIAYFKPVWAIGNIKVMFKDTSRLLA